MALRVPEVLWAQRTKPPVVFVTVDLQSIDPALAIVELTENKIHFKGKGGLDQNEYELNLNLYELVDVEKSTKGVGARGVAFLLHKKDEVFFFSMPFLFH
jgi:hypothetical protein